MFETEAGVDSGQARDRSMMQDIGCRLKEACLDV